MLIAGRVTVEPARAAGLAEAVTAPWQAGDGAEVSCEEFVAALRAATSDDRPLPSPAQAEAAATDLQAMVSPGYMHTSCDFNDDLDDDEGRFRRK